MQEPSYTTKRLKSWNQFQSFVNLFSSNWVFRGQSNANWDLKSSIERTEFFRSYPEVEQSFLLDFQRGAKNFLQEKEVPNDLIEWLALMQHHGAPTRLLDFTKSIYVASYFAFENTSPNSKDIAIWAINIQTVHDRVTKYLKLSNSEEFEQRRIFFSDKDFEDTKRQFNDKDFEQVFMQNAKSCIMPVEPFNMNKRYSLQQATFISAGNSNESFMEQLEFLGESLAKAVIKITLPSSLKNSVLRELEKMNINRASIFPDLDGYSAALKMKYNLRSSSDELDSQITAFIDKTNGKLHI